MSDLLQKNHTDFFVTNHQVINSINRLWNEVKSAFSSVYINYDP